jgi:DNA polymerase IIIc chi subunit
MTTRIDFYVLPDVDESARARFTCRLAHKAVGAGLRVHVHTASADASGELDALMWEYPAHQFLPHCMDSDPVASSAPVTIGHGAPAGEPGQLLINLSADVPAFIGRFERVAEIVVERQRARMREHYRQYRHRGYALYHHDMDQWEEE